MRFAGHEVQHLNAAIGYVYLRELLRFPEKRFTVSQLLVAAHGADAVLPRSNGEADSNGVLKGALVQRLVRTSTIRVPTFARYGPPTSISSFVIAVSPWAVLSLGPASPAPGHLAPARAAAGPDDPEPVATELVAAGGLDEQEADIRSVAEDVTHKLAETLHVAVGDGDAVDLLSQWEGFG